MKHCVYFPWPGVLHALAFTVFTLAGVARAQVINDGATATLSNVTNSFTGDVTVGTNGAFTLLVLSDNALLTNSVNGVIGLNVAAKSNQVRLISSSARWRMGNTLYVGSNGSFSTLVVSNGAFVDNDSGTLGNRIDSSNNLALVTGVGSMWSNRSDLRVGSGGRGNQLIVSNGGWVASRSGYVGNNATASNNFALVTGSGSVWSNASDLRVGLLGSSNRLVIEAGGLAHCDGGIVGSSTSASNNEALVTGPGSRWNNTSSLTIGSTAGRNRLVVSNGATVWSGSGLMGAISAASSNQVVVTGAGSTWSNQTFLNLGSTGNRVDVSDGGWLASNDGSFIGSSNTVVLTGGASGWNNPGGLIVGEAGSGNVLIASNGATVLSSDATLGVNGSTANNNLAVITGPGTLWSNRNSLLLGNFGVGNRLVVSSAAAMHVGGGGVIGLNSLARSNSVSVTDPGTTWLVNSNLYVGSNGAFSQLVVANGGRVTRRGNTYLGGDFSGSNNLLLVTGSGSVWSNAPGHSLIVGQASSGNQLIVSNGGWANLALAYCQVGGGNSGSDNHALITGAGSHLDVNNFVVGFVGARNRMVVTNGGAVTSLFANVGLNVGSANNEILVTGTGSTWASDLLELGNLSPRNQLVITNGGEVFGGIFGFNVGQLGVIVGDQPSSTNNRVVVDGGSLRITNAPGTGLLDIRRGTNVLNDGLIEADQLLMTNTQGRFEFNGGTLITRGAVISNGEAFVVGTTGTNPAVWDMRAGITHRLDDGVVVGGFGSGNRLVVSNGAALVTDSSSVIGLQFISSNNEAVVTGPGSTWTSGPGHMFVGYSSHDSRLLVSDGGLVASYAGYVGHAVAESSNNLAVVTGAGSTWSNAFELRVGNVGVGNRLVVSNSAVVSASNAVHVGFGPTSTKNRLTVDGGTLRVTNSFGTGVLDVRRGTNILNAGLIDVNQLVLTNALGLFELNGGTLQTGNTTVSNAHTFLVGTGSSAATLRLQGGTHSFANQLVIAGNASLVGNGTVIANPLIVFVGGNVSPGASIGKIVLSDSPVLRGAVIMEISKNGATLTNDQIQVTAPLTYDGLLTVSNLGPTTLAIGDRFPLFSANNYAGGFLVISLPSLPAGLSWMNKLLVDGSIEVVASPKFTSVTLSGTNVVVSGTGGTPNAPYAVLTATNVVLPLSNWVSIATNQFDPGGGFTFTNGIDPRISQRFFGIRTP